MKWAGNVGYIGDARHAYKILARKAAGKNLLGRPDRRWEDNIKI
jgi:hypothetical protein